MSMNNQNLKEKAFLGVLWNYANQFGTLLIGVIPSMILARLLSPAEFGLIAMTSIFNGLAFKLSTGGFSDALMQKKNASHMDCCSVYYTNLFLNIFFYAVFFFAAPYCAAFFDEPRITLIMRVSLLSLPLVALGGVHSVVLRKELNFKAPAIRNIIVQFVAAIIAVILAFCGCGVWALVVQGVLQTLGNSLVNWILCSWRPTIEFSMESIRSMLNFGMKTYISGLMNYGFEKAIDSSIAKFYTPVELAYYNRAFSTANICNNSILGAIDNVAFPAFVKLQGDTARLRGGISRMISVVCFVSLFMMAMSFVLAEPLFNFMYSSKWNAVIPLFQITCVWGLFKPIRADLENLLRAAGCAGIILHNRLVKYVLILMLIFWAYRNSVFVLVWGQVAIEFAQILIFSYFTSKFFKYGVLSIFKDVYKSVIPACFAALLAYVTDCEIVAYLENVVCYEFLFSFIRLFFSGVFGIVGYIAFNRFFKLATYENLVNLASEAIFKNSILKIKLQKVLIRK